MKINKNVIFILPFVLLLFLIKIKLHHNLQSSSSKGAIQQIIEPNLLKNISIDTLQKNETKKEYLQWIEDEIEKIWQEIEELFKVSKDACEKYITPDNEIAQETKMVQEAAKTVPPLNLEIVQCIESVLEDFNIDPKSILLLPFDNFCPAAANDYALYINEKLFSTLTPLAQKFCIGHELQHFIYKDSTSKWALRQLISSDLSSLAQDHPLNKLSRILELRADIIAALKNPYYAQGYKEFVTKTLEIIGEGAGISHPNNGLRLTYAEHIKTINI